MPMRTFDGVDDKVTLALGGTAFAFGPGTIAVILRRATENTFVQPVYVGTNLGSSRYGVNITNTAVAARCGGSAITAPTITSTVADGLVLLAWSKGNGSVPPRFHYYVFATDTWTHEDAASSAANSGVPTGNAYLGGGQSGQFLAGDIGIAAIWNVVLSDLEVEALVVAEANWSSVTPVALWPPSELGDPGTIQDTIGTADETSRTGTTITADDIPWTGSGGGATVERSASLSATTSITSTGTFWTTFERSSTLTATTSIATTGQRALQRSTSLTTTTSIATAGTAWTTHERSVALTATTGIATGQQRVLQRSSALTTTSAITVAGQVVGGAVTHERSAALSATTGIATAATFWTTFERAASLSAITAVTTGSERVLQRATSLTATTTIAVAGTVVGAAPVHERAASLTAATSIAVESLRMLQRAATLTATTSVSSTGQRDLQRSAGLTALTGISTGRQVAFHRQAALTAVMSVSASGLRVGPIQSVGRLEAGVSASFGESSSGVSSSESSSGVLALIE